MSNQPPLIEYTKMGPPHVEVGGTHHDDVSHDAAISDASSIANERCSVRGCANTFVTRPPKIFLPFPTLPSLRSRWLKVVGLDPARPPSHKLFCCEDHFDLKRDMNQSTLRSVNSGIVRNLLKDNVIPHKHINSDAPQPGSSAADDRCPLPEEEMNFFITSGSRSVVSDPLSSSSEEFPVKEESNLDDRCPLPEEEMNFFITSGSHSVVSDPLSCSTEEFAVKEESNPALGEAPKPSTGIPVRSTQELVISSTTSLSACTQPPEDDGLGRTSAIHDPQTSTPAVVPTSALGTNPHSHNFQFPVPAPRITDLPPSTSSAARKRNALPTTDDHTMEAKISKLGFRMATPQAGGRSSAEAEWNSRPTPSHPQPVVLDTTVFGQLRQGMLAVKSLFGVLRMAEAVGARASLCDAGEVMMEQLLRGLPQMDPDVGWVDTSSLAPVSSVRDIILEATKKARAERDTRLSQLGDQLTAAVELLVAQRDSAPPQSPVTAEPIRRSIDTRSRKRITEGDSYSQVQATHPKMKSVVPAERERTTCPEPIRRSIDTRSRKRITEGDSYSQVQATHPKMKSVVPAERERTTCPVCGMVTAGLLKYRCANCKAFWNRLVVDFREKRLKADCTDYHPDHDGGKTCRGCRRYHCEKAFLAAMPTALLPIPSVTGAESRHSADVVIGLREGED